MKECNQGELPRVGAHCFKGLGVLANIGEAMKPLLERFKECNQGRLPKVGAHCFEGLGFRV